MDGVMLQSSDRNPASSPRLFAEIVGESGIAPVGAEEWHALALNAAEPNAFSEHWYLAPALRHLAGKRQLRTIAVRDDHGKLAGIMAVTTSPRYGRAPAMHVTNWIHFQCFMGTPLVRKDACEAFWLAVLDLLDRSSWAPGFLSIQGLDETGPVCRGLFAAAARLKRPCPIVHRYQRAMLQTRLGADAYLAQNVRGKKRKELRRLANRLADLGEVRFSVLKEEAQLSSWIRDFLMLESSGWKGREGAAFAREAGMTAFFHDVMTGAQANGRLDFQRLDIDGAPIAMLINFRTPPGSWSFKIAYDEAMARFSPGVLIEMENLRLVLQDEEVDWMDSCAAPDHPMINSLWAERRSIVQLSTPLSGVRRRAVYAACRAAETGSSAFRRVVGR
jgi:hypothetical protein